MTLDPGLHRGSYDQSGLPTDQSGVLRNSPEDLNVQTGPNGTVVVTQRDTLGGTPVSQQGLPGTEKGHDAYLKSVIAGEAQLQPPDYEGEGFFNNMILKAFDSPFIKNLMKPTNSDEKTDTESSAHDDSPLSFYGTSDDDSTSFDSNSIFNMFSSAARTQSNRTSSSTATNSSSQTSNTTTNNSTSSATNSTTGASETSEANDPTAHTVSNTIHTSKDKEEIYNQLKALVDYTTDPSLTDAQRSLIESKLRQFAELLAKNNPNSTELNYYDPITLFSKMDELLNLKNDTTLSTEDQTLVRGYFLSLAEDMGAINAAAGVTPPENPIFTGINSADAQKIYDTLLQLSGLETDPRFAQLSGTEKQNMKNSLKAIAEQLASKNQAGKAYGIESVSQKTLLLVLLKQANV